MKSDFETPVSSTPSWPREEDSIALAQHRSRRVGFFASGLAILAAVMITWVSLFLLQGGSKPSSSSTTALMPRVDFAVERQLGKKQTEIYLGNGCFWERQWAYYVVETNASGPFVRTPNAFTAKCGYAGGQAPATADQVCYHSDDARDYTTLGHAEAVRVLLDDDRLHDQMRALAADYFASFQGDHGHRIRPDPQDAGAPYRSFVGLPGGVGSPLYPTLAAENTFGMQLKPSAGGSDPDEANTVWVYDTATFPFWHGEVYHQCHCNFFMSEGMPYPTSYTQDVFNAKKAAGEYVPTGCPEGVMPHPGQLCNAFE